MKRTELRRGVPLARSAERAARPRAPRMAGSRSPRGNPIPPTTRAAVRERSGGRCEIRAAECAGLAHEQHHRRRRRDGGHGLSNLLDACRSCHAYAHANPRVARDAGWIVSAYETDPAGVPIRSADGWTWLHDDGTKTVERVA